MKAPGMSASSTASTTPTVNQRAGEIDMAD